MSSEDFDGLNCALGGFHIIPFIHVQKTMTTKQECIERKKNFSDSRKRAGCKIVMACILSRHEPCWTHLGDDNYNKK